MRKKKGALELGEGHYHRPKETRPHLAEEILDLHGFSTDHVYEHITRLLPSVRHRALAVKPGALPSAWMRQHVQKQSRAKVEVING